jgi:hypothetical protein
MAVKIRHQSPISNGQAQVSGGKVTVTVQVDEVCQSLQATITTGTTSTASDEGSLSNVFAFTNTVFHFNATASTQYTLTVIGTNANGTTTSTISFNALALLVKKK